MPVVPVLEKRRQEHCLKFKVSQANLSATLEVLDSSIMEPSLLMTSLVVMDLPLESAKAACVLHSYDHPIDMSISGNHAKSENNDEHHVFCVFT